MVRKKPFSEKAFAIFLSPWKKPAFHRVQRNANNKVGPFVVGQLVRHACRNSLLRDMVRHGRMKEIPSILELEGVSAL